MGIINIVWRYEKMTSFKKIISGLLDFREILESQNLGRNVSIHLFLQDEAQLELQFKLH